ncbi:MAG: hypothetical protein KF861_17150 [Planctomycetaceae bacterium]|nr:hypothetical protein [Planctomycetaceae bacterium]
MSVRFLMVLCLSTLLSGGPAWGQEADGPPSSDAAVANGESPTQGQPGDGPATIDATTILPPELAQKIDWEFRSLPLNQVLDEFSRRIEMPVMLDEVHLDEIGIGKKTRISDDLPNLPAYLLLDRLLMPHRLAWYIDDGIVIVTSVEAAEAHLTTQSHLVTDLRQAGYDMAGLIDVIQRATAGPWENIDGIGGSISPVGDVLVVRQTDRVLREVAALLAALRHHGRATGVLDPAEHQNLRAQLGDPVNVAFHETPLQSAIEWLRSETQLDFFIHEGELNDFGLPLNEPVTLTLENKPLQTVLRYLLDPIQLTVVPY